MTVEQTDVVDVISIDKKTGSVVLTISDHLGWSDSAKHQTVLQAKFNAYLRFVESGELQEQYPNAKDRAVIFNVVFQFSPDLEGRRFLNQARKVIESAKISLRHEVFAVSRDN